MQPLTHCQCLSNIHHATLAHIFRTHVELINHTLIFYSVFRLLVPDQYENKEGPRADPTRAKSPSILFNINPLYWLVTTHYGV